MRLRLPEAMVGRILLVLIAAILLELLGNLALQKWQERELLSDREIERIAGRLSAAEAAILTLPPRDRGDRLHDLADGDLSLNWVPRTVITDFSASFAQLQSLRARLVKAAPRLAPRALRLTLMPSAERGKRDLVGALQIADGSFITFRLSPYLGAPPDPRLVILLHLLLVAAVLSVALVMIRALVRPLSDLAAAADRTSGGRASPIATDGPAEVRRVAKAFSAMQDRLFRAMDDQTQALVAVSHDLRTPIQRLRLRTALLRDDDARDAMGEDLAEMESFIEATLSYFRSGEDEAPRLIDAAALVATVVDTAADLGDDITYRGLDELLVMGRPVTIRRILANLTDNARRHAGRIEMTLRAEGADRFTIDIDDDGPGIPADRRDEALLPFRRLDEARARECGGAGIGLAAAHKAATSMGGSLTLRDSALGGLGVNLSLPRGDMPSA
ncbi:MAG: histidine kinase [Sphingopyxis macrogoltabida]|uniref:histidine kinase n=1 Tax=Sphingopyxis macrogoltabida TaxID=33050 RepID=A0A2W5L1Y6_SPHMC|nr:MAG: histidine kinase [Sphingopyxis macrogoltabida]